MTSSTIISRENILSVANSIDIKLSEEEIQNVMLSYYEEAELDPNSTVEEVIEGCIYDVI